MPLAIVTVLLALLALCCHLAGAEPLKVCLVSGSAEYKSDESLTAFKAYVEANFSVACSLVLAKDGGDSLPGIEAIDTTDVALIFTRRLKPPADQLDRVKKYCQAGRPVVGLRTASHAFQPWLEFDKEVLGGNYKNHYGAGPEVKVSIAEKAKGHPILAGVQPFTTKASLYRNTGLAADVELLLTGTSAEHSEPIAWTRVHNGGRVFYTSLGAPEDFANDDFKRMLVNSLFWVAKRTPEARLSPAAK